MADLCLYLAAIVVTLRRLIQRARNRYRWPGRQMAEVNRLYYPAGRS